MSVAFRRESDEEHLEPRFELPIPPGPNLVTQRGYDLIHGRTQELETQISTEGLSEEQRTALRRDLRYWRTRLATARIAPTPSGDTVAIGTRVTLDHNGSRRTLTIVGHDEADPSSGLLAYSSPLGRALIGAEPGDQVDAPGGGQPLTVIGIDLA